jgi:hypothetical protein
LTRVVILKRRPRGSGVISDKNVSRETFLPPPLPQEEGRGWSLAKLSLNPSLKKERETKKILILL